MRRCAMTIQLDRCDTFSYLSGHQSGYGNAIKYTVQPNIARSSGDVNAQVSHAFKLYFCNVCVCMCVCMCECVCVNPSK